MGELLTSWLMFAAFWLILGIVLILVEMTVDGSFVFFLPVGVAAFANAALLFVQELWLAPDLVLLGSWGSTLVSLAVLALLAAFALRFYTKGRARAGEEDVNDY